MFALNNEAALQPPVFTSASLPNGTVNASYNFSVTAAGAPAPSFAVATGTLPSGLALDVLSGLVDGTPNAAGTFTGTIKSTNGVSPDATQTFAIVIARSPQTLAFGSLVNVPLGGGPLFVSATASSGLPVAFASLSMPICTIAGSTVALISVGSCTLQAAQAGNATYLPAALVNQTFSVTANSQTIAFAPLGNRALGSMAFTLSATSSSGLPVAFASLTSPTCAVNGTTVTLIAQGTCTIRATQAGNALFAAANPVDQSFAISAGAVIQYSYDAAGNVVRIQRASP